MVDQKTAEALVQKLDNLDKRLKILTDILETLVGALGKHQKAMTKALGEISTEIGEAKNILEMGRGD